MGFSAKPQIPILVDCAPLRVPVAHMSTDDASKLKNSCSRTCLGLVSVMCQSWFCVAWVMSRGVTVMSRSCFRNALLMSRGCRGGCRDDVLVTPRVLFRWCHVDVSVLFL